MYPPYVQVVPEVKVPCVMSFAQLYLDAPAHKYGQ